MSDLHNLHALAQGPGALEGVDPSFVREKLLWARTQSWKVYDEIRAALKVGMTEEDARKLSLDIFRARGVQRHWHRPYVRFGPGTTLTFHQPMQTDYRLQENDPVYLDLGPVWPDPDSSLEYEGDVGDTYHLGTNLDAQTCADVAREIFHTLENQWREERLSGQELYRRALSLAEARGYLLTENVDGHRLSDFPHQKHSKERLCNVASVPSAELWVFEIHIKHPTLPVGAFVEDMLMVSDSDSRF